MNKQFLGGILLIIGTCIGGGMLALPVVTAETGFLNATMLLLIAFIVMTYSALILTEVNLSVPPGSNLMSMAAATLGKPGVLVTWFVYLILLYTLLSAYIAGGSELFVNLMRLIHISLTTQIGAILFATLFAFFTYKGIGFVDLLNRGLMSGKMLAFILLCSLLVPHIESGNLHYGNWGNANNALMMIFTAFGFGVIIPSIRDYFNNQAHQIRLAVIIGSFVPLVCYAGWIAIVQSTVTSYGPHGLIAINHAEHPIALLVNIITEQIGNRWVGMFVYFFTSICILTALLGVSLSLSDFLADGLKRKLGLNQFMITLLTFLPPLSVVLFKPDIFILGLSYAGILCIMLLLLIPTLMVWSKRYIKKMPTTYQVFGGKICLASNLIAGVGLIIFGIYQLH